MKKRVTKLIRKLKNFHPPKILAFLFLLIPIFFALDSALIIDNDFWFLEHTGKYIVKHGFPLIEPFTIHQNLSFVIQQWLVDVIFYYIHLFLGSFGIILLTMILFLFILYITYKLCMLVSENRLHLSVFLTVIIGYLLSLVFVRARPQMFDFAILLVLLYKLELYIRTKNKKHLYILPLLSILLINLHASSWFMLFAFILPYIINAFHFKFLCFESEGYEKKPLFITAFAMLLVGLINPYGIRAITYIFTSYGNTYINQIVNEMKPPLVSSITGITTYFSILMVLLCYLINKKETIKIRYFLLLLGTSYLALSSLKGFSFFIIASIFPLGDYLKENFRVYKEEYHYSKRFKFQYGILVSFIFIFFGIYIVYNQNNPYHHRIYKVVDYLEQVEKIDKKTSKIYTSYDDGAFAEYKDLRVYLDPRAEIFLKKNNHQKDIMKEYYLLQNGRVNIENFLNDYDFDYLIVNGKHDYLYKYYLNTKQNKTYKEIFKTKNDMYLYKKKI